MVDGGEGSDYCGRDAGVDCGGVGGFVYGGVGGEDGTDAEGDCWGMICIGYMLIHIV